MPRPCDCHLGCQNMELTIPERIGYTLLGLAILFFDKWLLIALVFAFAASL